MKSHVLLAALISFLAVGYMIIAPETRASQPDTIENIAYYKGKLIHTEQVQRPTWRRGLMAIV